MHKVPIDVEAEDKFLGPLSFKQFLYLGGTIISGYLVFVTYTKATWVLSIPFVLTTIIFGFLTFPWSKEQPTELWLASRIRFLIMPRKRVWNQSGVKQMVEITVPVKQIMHLTDGLNVGEVQNRLSALANIVDSRGWAIKNYMGGAAVQEEVDNSDRLVQGTIASPSLNLDTELLPDVMEEPDGTIARQFEPMIQKSESKHKTETLHIVDEARARASKAAATNGGKNLQTASYNGAEAQNDKAKDQDFWFLHQQQTPRDPSLATFQQSAVVSPGAQSASPQPLQPASGPDPQSATDISDDELLQKVHEKKRKDDLQTHSSHLKTVQPLWQSDNPLLNPDSTKNPPAPTSTNPVILNLARSNDLNVATLARQSHKKDDELTDEVVIKLH